ncbi:hypothetical protein [uncultured Piscinibacter sp.]|uniref:hypothetical protein n=1 Tax=uncultured Piscinibacter sp. TaxID=1131835 RepID=UPI0026358237|nr:hypothetical protein [uncultured Piscinibacter sp.]
MDHAVLPFSHRIAPFGVALTATVAVAAAGLLVGIGEVAREAVHQGELRRAATARHSQATWRCNTLRSMKQRDACLKELNAPPPQQVPVTLPRR